VAELSLETPLEDLGLDFLDKLCLLFEIEDLFNVAIPDVTASQIKCGADILAYVASSQRGPSH
jgi:acyl carrier protein